MGLRTNFDQMFFCPSRVVVLSVVVFACLFPAVNSIDGQVQFPGTGTNQFVYSGKLIDYHVRSSVNDTIDSTINCDGHIRRHKIFSQETLYCEIEMQSRLGAVKCSVTFNSNGVGILYYDINKSSSLQSNWLAMLVAICTAIFSSCIFSVGEK